jgi:transposase
MPELLERKRYSSDLDDAEWGLIEPLLPPLIEKGWGAPCRWHRRDVVDAIIYVIKTGCPWRDLPGDFPPWNTVWKWFCRWRKDGTWARAHDALRAQTRVAAGRDAEPSLALLDSQTVKGTEYTTPQRPPPAVDAAAVLAALTAPDDPAAAGVTAEQIATAVLGPHHGVPAEHVPAVVAAAIVGVGEAPARPFPKARDRVGYDGGKKVKGRKRHLLVDTQGLVQSVVVHGADVHDSVGAALVLARRVGSMERLQKILADMAYQGPPHPVGLRAVGRDAGDRRADPRVAGTLPPTQSLFRTADRDRRDSRPCGDDPTHAATNRSSRARDVARDDRVRAGGVKVRDACLNLRFHSLLDARSLQRTPLRSSRASSASASTTL